MSLLRMAAISALLCLLGACAPVPEASTGDGSTAAERSESQGEKGPPPLAHSPDNLFRNPSFESGRDPWYAMTGPRRPYWTDFLVDDAVAHTGRHSALLPLTSEGYDGDVRIYGAIQEVSPTRMPKRLAGWFRVEDWQRGTKNQYIQVVVIFWDPVGMPSAVGRAGNAQISWVLGGITEPPFSISNRRFLFVGPGEPKEGEWIRIERDLEADMLEAWGAVPKGFSKMRILWEVRYDGRKPSDPPARAKVWFDDLYLGP